jgi:hypothetical protein
MLPAAMMAAGCAAGSAAPPAGGAGPPSQARAVDEAGDGGSPAYVRRLQIARQRDLLGKDIAVLREGNRALLEEIDVLRDDLRRIGQRPPELPDLAAAARSATVKADGGTDEPTAAEEVDRRLQREVSRQRALRDGELAVRQELLKFRLHLRNELKLRGVEPVRPE